MKHYSGPTPGSLGASMQFAASCTGQRSVSSTTIYPNQIRTFLKLLNCKIFSLSQIFAINPGNIRRISCVEAWCGVCMLYAGAQGVTPAGRGSRGRHQPRLSFNSLQPPASHITTEMRRHTAVLGWAVAGEKLLWISAGVWRQLVCKSKVSL